MSLQKYEDIAAFNLEGFYLRIGNGLELMEFVPTFNNYYGMKEKEGYLGVFFVFDNINQEVWIYQDDEIKTQKVVKSLKKEKKVRKLAEKTVQLFVDMRNVDITSYAFVRAKDDEDALLELFKYQINEYPLYTQHYYLPRYEGEKEALEVGAVEQWESEEEVSTVMECKNCGWVISKGAEVCPKCRRDPTKKFDGEKEE